MFVNKTDWVKLTPELLETIPKDFSSCFAIATKRFPPALRPLLFGCGHYLHQVKDDVTHFIKIDH